MSWAWVYRWFAVVKWSSCRMKVMCSCFLDNVTRQAEEFYIRWRLLNRHYGRPNKMLFEVKFWWNECFSCGTTVQVFADVAYISESDWWWSMTCCWHVVQKIKLRDKMMTPDLKVEWRFWQSLTFIDWREAGLRRPHACFYKTITE